MKKLDLRNAVPLPLPTNQTVVPDHDYASSMQVPCGQEKIDDLVNKNVELNQKLIDLTKKVKELESEKEKISQAKHYLNRKSDSLSVTVKDLKSSLDNVKERYDIDSDVIESLKKCASDVPQHLFKSISKRARGKRDKEFHPSIKKFALSLHLCSSKAYNYVRSEFEDALPAERTLRHCSSVEGEPGFSKESLDLLKRMAASKAGECLVSLSLDEMALKSHIQFDGNQFIGGAGKDMNIDENVFFLLALIGKGAGGPCKK